MIKYVLLSVDGWKVLRFGRNFFFELFLRMIIDNSATQQYTYMYAIISSGKIYTGELFDILLRRTSCVYWGTARTRKGDFRHEGGNRLANHQE